MIFMCNCLGSLFCHISNDPSEKLWPIKIFDTCFKMYEIKDRQVSKIPILEIIARKVNCCFPFIIKAFKGTVSVILSEPQYKDENVRFESFFF